MKHKGMFLAGLILVLLALLLMAGCTSGPDEPAQSGPAPQKTITPAATQVPGVQVRIDYPGSWTAAIGYGAANIKSVDGAGPTTYNLDEPGRIVTVTAQKGDDSGRQLTVLILKGGKVQATESTTAAYGLAMTSATF